MLINGEEHSELCIGIDLGTTNSVLAAITIRPNGNIVSKVIDIDRAVDMFSGADGVARLAMQKGSTLPSCVYYDEDNNFRPIVGNFAKSRYSLRPHLVAKSIKSQMGNPVAQGLSPNIPDKTPAQISSQILLHMLKHASKVFRKTEINDAIITVPANFDIGWQATLDAAKLAGIKIQNADGSFRPILLPEPEAVIYDFMNQANNGEISAEILDLNTPKKVMVFDLGGGTLDVTLHEISRRKDAPELLKMEPLAINRYTLLGGDNFDSALAQKMFAHYVEQYRANPEVVQKIRREEKAIMPQLLNQAEDLKIKVSMEHSEEFGGGSQAADAWGDEEDNYPVGGNISATGYAYYDTFTTQELEEIWSVFMGNDLKFEDFKNLDAVAENHGTLNIIFPILDVLKKASDKLGTEDFKIDAVIMNGGMSRFYMVVDRLKKFFGFDPIVALDPDLSVARGSAVYHYYLHKYIGRVAVENKPAVKSAETSKTAAAPKVDAPKEIPPVIKLLDTILPESLYLLTQGNHYEEIIKTGTSLPHESKTFIGFKLPKATNKISIPIARRNNDNSYSIIAKGNMVFPEKYSFSTKDNFISFVVAMNEQRIIKMRAFICADPEGRNILDEGTTEIALAQNADGTENISAPTAKFPPAPGGGVRVNPQQALNDLLNHCKKFAKAQREHRDFDAKKYAALIREAKQNICRANNPRDFAEPLINFFNANSSNEDFKMHCVIIGRKIGVYWNDTQKRRLANCCMSQLQREINFSYVMLGGRSVNTKIQSIYTLHMCGSNLDLEQLKRLHNYTQFQISLLYTHAMTKTSVDWIYNEFKRDYEPARHGRKSGIQNTAHALGIAFRLGDGKPTQAAVTRERIVSELCTLIRQKNMSYIEIGRCFLALGLICDCRYKNNISQKSLTEAQNLIDDLKIIYDPNFIEKFIKAVIVAEKMIHGDQLNAEEEDSLLIKLDD